MTDEFPQVFLLGAGHSEAEAARWLGRNLRELGLGAPLVLRGIHGELLAAGIETRLDHVTPPPDADQEWTSGFGSTARRSGADAIVALGGGRCLDVAKLAAARAGIPVICVPTQLSHDGICSPVAVVPDETNRRRSLGAISPRAVFISIPTLLISSGDAVRAGVGDLLANPFALRDWALASGRGLAATEERSWELSRGSYDLIAGDLDDDISELAKDPGFLVRLADGLIMSGRAMISAGNSRPASGGEHEISHAIDDLYGARCMHGAQVAFGCIISSALYELDVPAFRKRLERLGLPNHPGELGLGSDDMVAVLLGAPDTRPGRFTVLEDADLDENMARSLIKRIWGDG